MSATTGVVERARALVAAATPVESWTASWDSAHRGDRGWVAFATGPEHTLPRFDADNPEPYRKVERQRLADARLIAAAPSLIAELYGTLHLAQCKIELLEERLLEENRSAGTAWGAARAARDERDSALSLLKRARKTIARGALDEDENQINRLLAEIRAALGGAK